MASESPQHSRSAPKGAANAPCIPFDIQIQELEDALITVCRQDIRTGSDQRDTYQSSGARTRAPERVRLAYFDEA